MSDHANLNDGIDLVNAFPQEKLSLLLRRILQSPDPPACVFTEQEQTQLMAMGNMSASQVSALLGAVTRIVSTAGYHNWDEHQFVSEVGKLGVLEATASALSTVWWQERSTYRDALLRASTTSGQLPSVTDSHWRMHVTIADSVATGHATPHALFHLHTTKSSPSSTAPSEDNAIHMEMNHADLYDISFNSMRFKPNWTRWPRRPKGCVRRAGRRHLG